jgi:F0F1-type ATP synthase epsilon subunit
LRLARMKIKESLFVEVRSRQGLTFGGELEAVTAYNSVGPFDVLPRHSNFISMITKKIILRQHDGRTDEIALENGIMMVEENKVYIFLGVTKV